MIMSLVHILGKYPTMTVSQHSQINASTYNSLQSTVTNILGLGTSGYGVNVQSSQVAAGDIISNVQWDLLEHDVGLINTHQTGGTANFNRDIAVKASYVNNLINTVNNLNVNTFTIGQSGSTLVGLHTGDSSWITNYTLTTKMSWSTPLRAKYFFNLGSSITPVISVSGDDADNWQSLIDQANAVTFNYTQFYGSLPYTQTFSSGNRALTVSFSLSGSVLTIELDFETPSSTLNNLTVTSKFNIIYSTGAIPAILPQVQISSVDTGGTPHGFLTYAPNPVPDFTAPVNQGAPQTITLTNNSNIECHITGITSTGFPFSSYQLGTTILGPTASTNLTVTYIGTEPGTKSSTIIVNSNVNTLNIAADVITQVIVVLKPTPTPAPPTPPGPTPAPTPAPAPPINIQTTVITQTITKLGTYQYPISLAVSGTKGSSYSATLANGQSGNSSYPGIFALINASGNTTNSASFTLGFTTYVSNTAIANGVYTNTINFVLTPSDLNQAPINLQIPVTITVNVVNQKLGSWLSPINENNGVIGMDYSIIGGHKYLTIGFGISTGAYNYAYMPYAMKLLGFYGMNLYGSSNTPYYHQPAGAYSTFLQTYGIWFANTRLLGTYSDTYVFQVNSADNYAWEFSCDDYGYFTIDGTQIANVSGNYGTSAQGSVYLTAGVHTIVWHVTNTNAAGSVGIRITEPNTNTDVWSTLAATYNYANNIYGYWSEVYRIPISGTDTYHTNINYQTYTQFASGQTQTYGSYFGFQDATGSMFTVTSDSDSNLSIALNGLRAIDAINTDINTTLNEVQYLFYYYSTADERLNNLADPIGNQTQYFIGFNSAGAVQTMLIPYASGNLGVGWCNSGGCIGGGGGE